MKTRPLNLTGISAPVTRERAKQLFAAMKREVAMAVLKADCDTQRDSVLSRLSKLGQNIVDVDHQDIAAVPERKL